MNYSDMSYNRYVCICIFCNFDESNSPKLTWHNPFRTYGSQESKHMYCSTVKPMTTIWNDYYSTTDEMVQMCICVKACVMWDQQTVEWDCC